MYNFGKSQIRESEKLIAPFAVFSESKELLFSTSKFEEIHKKNDELKDYIRDTILPTDALKFSFNDLTIFKKRFTIASNNDYLFFIYIHTDLPNSLILLRHYHDIQAPLRNISNFLQLIKIQLNNTKDSSLKKYADFAISNAKKLSEFTEEQLLRYKDTPRVCLNLKKLIMNIMDLLRNQIDQRQCTLQVDDNIPDLDGYYFSIFSLFKNLIENSLEHAVTDRLLIKISTISYNNSQVVIQFEDNGKNFSKEQRRIINGLLKGGSYNNSIGLSICNEAIKRHSGNIILKTYSSGCSYHITLPVCYK